MSKVKKTLAGAAVIAGVVAVEMVVENLTGFTIPQTVFVTCGAMFGIAVYKSIAERIDAVEK